MSESPTTIDNFSEDEAATLVLVDVNDSPLGSVSLTERLLIENSANEQIIHRTCSLHIFWTDDPTGKGSSTSRILLSRSLPPTVVGEEFGNSSHVSLPFNEIKHSCPSDDLSWSSAVEICFDTISHFCTIAFVVAE